jgi:hypothetical protein
MRPSRVDFVIDLTYGVVLFLAIVLILTVGTSVGVAFGLGALVSYIIHVAWKMARFDPEWMSREMAANIEEQVAEEVAESVEEQVAEEVAESVEEQVADSLGEQVAEEVTETVERTFEEGAGGAATANNEEGDSTPGGR